MQQIQSTEARGDQKRKEKSCTINFNIRPGSVQKIRNQSPARYWKKMNHVSGSQSGLKNLQLHIGKFQLKSGIYFAITKNQGIRLTRASTSDFPKAYELLTSSFLYIILFKSIYCCRKTSRF